MKQSKLESFIEACVNTLTGFLITIFFLPIVNKICDINMSPSQMGLSTAIFTIISVLRGFFIRRFFENNIAVISDLANTMKNDSSINELITFGKNIQKYLEENLKI